jgi:chromosome partitioning protein
MAQILSFINYKGGVGKTTTTYHIGCALALYHDKRVLLVDIDPQTNLTFLCAVQDRWQQHKNRGGGTVVSLYKRYLEGKDVDIRKGIWKSPIKDRQGAPLAPNLDLIPSDLELLIDQDVKVLGATKLSRTNPLAAQVSEIKIRAEHYVIPRIFLTQVLKQCDKDYDYVLIDCPPNLYLLTQNALLASPTLHYHCTS